MTFGTSVLSCWKDYEQLHQGELLELIPILFQSLFGSSSALLGPQQLREIANSCIIIICVCMCLCGVCVCVSLLF